MTVQQKRERALETAIARGMAAEGIKYDMDLAKAIDMSPATYSRHKNSGYQKMELSEFAAMVRRLHFTGAELCAAIGVPYE